MTELEAELEAVIVSIQGDLEERQYWLEYMSLSISEYGLEGIPAIDFLWESETSHPRMGGLPASYYSAWVDQWRMK